ncbi:MAG: paraquat-inducible protein A [Gammaproteobacteria bacterium]
MSRPIVHSAAERVACPDCGLVQLLPAIRRGDIAECRQCGRVLTGAATGRVDVPLGLSVAALLLLIPASGWQLMDMVSFGNHRASWISSGVETLWASGFPSLALLVALFSIVLPLVFLVLVIAVLGGLHFGLNNERTGRSRAAWGRASQLGGMYRWAMYLRPWMMLEVYLVGCIVAYSRLRAIAPVDVGIGGWSLIAGTFALMFALTQLDDRTVWEALPHRPNDVPDGKKSLACTVCDLISDQALRGKACSRCGSTLRVRKPNALQLTTALVLAGYLLYIPANLLPVLTIVRFGRVEHNTIMSGVFELVDENLWPLALIVFVASIVLPLLKLCSLTWMVLATRQGSPRFLVGRTRLYRMIDAVGRWSNIDVFMTSILVAVLQFGAVTAVRAGSGLVAFAAVVVITMMATLVFDSRLMWDAPRGRA